MRAGPSQEEIRRHNLGALLRYVHVHGPTSRAELTSRARAQPQHHRRAHRRPGRRRAWSARSCPARPAGPDGRRWWSGPSRTGSTRTRFEHRGGPAARRPGSASAATILDRRETVPAARHRSLDEVVGAAGRVRHGDAPQDPCRRRVLRRQRRRGRRHGAPRGRRGPARPDTSAGSTSRSARRWRRSSALGLPVTVRQRRRPRRPGRAHPGVGVGCDNVIYLHGDVGIGGGIIAGGRR